MTDNEIREQNKKSIRKFMEEALDVTEFYAEDGLKSLPFFPPNGAYWKGKDLICKNSEMNKDQFAGFEYTDIKIHDCVNPKVFWIEASGSTSTCRIDEDGGCDEAGEERAYETQYIIYFEFNDEGKVVEYREYFSPMNLFAPLGIAMPYMAMPPYSVGKDEI